MRAYFNRYSPAATLALFRVIFGIMLFLSICRFWAKGWISDLYILPKFHFPFFGFEFIRPLGEWTYALFGVCGVASLLVAAGLFYRLSAIMLFLSFTYIELMDKSTYLNHYYFVSMVSFMLIFLPAHASFSFDAFRNKKLLADQLPSWCIDSIRLLVCIIYFYAGLAKLNSDWLLHALPLKIWLPAQNDLPVIGGLFNYKWTPYLFSWAGCVYDLSIGFLLWNKKTRPYAFISVIIFHLLTAVLFPIGMFPYIMIVTAFIFFPGELHQKIIDAISFALNLPIQFIRPKRSYIVLGIAKPLLLTVFALFFTFQITFPFRYLMYSDELFWTEEGYRFSWRVMLMEKAGYTQFTVTDASGKKQIVNNNDFLTRLQEKMMSTQPDMILQYAHMLRDHYAAAGFKTPQVYVDSYVALNGRIGKPIIDPAVDLAKQTDSFQHKSWIIPFNDEIKGL
ncbi:HTTM domain-containing protein [Dyadobacter alkalitolerans]|uniref:HTTM domain-containing protein n=1 Tax=Dyadobacter alkalitolerans TaxID=492736 RepID=UPI0003FE150A|nr:HTTM domain-containing protein [Dyadobacter alkalitolerans]